MQNRVDFYLPKALKAVTKIYFGGKSFINKEGKIPNEYKGYISSLGASIIQAGIYAALIFYEAAESESKSDRRLVIAAIKYIISDNPADNDYRLSTLLNDLLPEEKVLKAQQILDAATALKLAVRTYKMED